MLGDAFRQVLSIHHRKMTLKRIGIADSQEIQATPSNYTRQLAGPGETIFEGREFVISTHQLKPPFNPIKRGDRLVDPTLGSLTINTIVEMYDVGGSIIGLRVTTE